MEEEEQGFDPSLPPSEQFSSYIDSPKLACAMCCTQIILDCVETPNVCSLDYLKNTLIPGIEKLSHFENSQVKENLIYNLPTFCDDLFEHFHDEAEQIILSHIIPCIDVIVHEDCFALSEQISECYANVISLLNSTDLLSQLPHILEYAHSTQKEIRIISANVLSCLVDLFDPSTWYPKIYEIITVLVNDQLGSVRAVTPPLIALYMKHLNTPTQKAQLSSRFPLFAHDSTISVRRAAAESLVDLSQSLDSESRSFIVLPLANQLLSDSAEAVRSVISRNLGPLIATFGPKADSSLISKYCLLTSSRDINLSFAAAFSLPAVAVALGKERWPEIKPYYEKLCNAHEYRIRRTLAFGLEYYSSVLSSSELEETAVLFLKDLPTVSIGVIASMSTIAKLLPPENRITLQFALSDPIKKYKDWRIRLKVSEQLRECKDFFSRDVLFESACMLVEDDVYLVRKDAAISFAKLMTQNNLNSLLLYATSDSYLIRAIAADIYANVDITILQNDYEPLLKLAADPVPNVKIAAARAISKIYKEMDKLNNGGASQLEQILQNLQNDPDIDVKEAVE